MAASDLSSRPALRETNFSHYVGQGGKSRNRRGSPADWGLLGDTAKPLCLLLTAGDWAQEVTDTLRLTPEPHPMLPRPALRPPAAARSCGGACPALGHGEAASTSRACQQGRRHTWALPCGPYPCCHVGGGWPAQPLAALGATRLPHWLAPGCPGAWFLLSRGSARLTST